MSAARSDVNLNQFVFVEIKKTIKSVFGEILFKGTTPLLHIHASSGEYIAEFVSKQGYCGNAFFFGSVAFFQQTANFMFRKKSLDAIENFCFIKVAL